VVLAGIGYTAEWETAWKRDPASLRHP